MNRRELMTALPFAALVASAAARATADEDPILPIYREWQAARAQWAALADLPGNENWDHPDSLEAERREYAALDAMLETNPTTPAGFAALADVLWNLEGPSCRQSAPDFEERASVPAMRMIVRIWQAGSGQTGLPPSQAKG